MGLRIKLLNHGAEIIGVDSLFEPFTLPVGMLELIKAEDLGSEDKHPSYECALEQLCLIMKEVGGGKSTKLRHVVESLVAAAGLKPVVDRPQNPRSDPARRRTKSFAAVRRLPEMADAMRVYSSRLSKLVCVRDWEAEHTDIDDADARRVLAEIGDEEPSLLDVDAPLPSDPLLYRCERYKRTLLESLYNEAAAQWAVLPRRSSESASLLRR